MQILLFMLIPMVFFGSGMLFASLLWGKYKQLVFTLQDKVARQDKREAELLQAITQAQGRLSDLETTCHTLEEELAIIARERDALKAEVEASHGELNERILQIRRLDADRATLTQNRDQLNDAVEKARADLEQRQIDLTAVQSRMKTLEREKQDYLDLVSKLQAETEKMIGLRANLAEGGQRMDYLKARMRREQRRRRHSMETRLPRRTSRRLQARKHHSALSSEKAAIVPTIAPSISNASKPAATAMNGHRSGNQENAGVAKRMFSSVGKLLGNREEKSNHRHW